MKKQLFLILLMLPFIAFAQGFGVRAGVNFANMSIIEKETYNENTTTEEVNGKSNMGLSFAVFYDIPLSDTMFVELGAGFSQKGIKIVEVDDDETYTEKLILNYIEVPILFKYVTEISGTNVYGKIGPNIGFGVSGKSKWEDVDDTEVETGENTEHIFGDDEDKDLLKPLDIGLKLGGGVIFNNIEVGLEYGFSLNNLSLRDDYTYNDYGVDYKYSNSIKNKVFSITIGYTFGK